MAKKKRKRVSADVKIKALQNHIMEKQPVSEVCDQLGVQPSAFYGWQRDLFARGARVFEVKPGPPKTDHSADRIAALEAKLAKKDEVIAELLQEHIALKKKSWGDLSGKWTELGVRDEVIDFVGYWNEKTQITAKVIIDSIGLPKSKYHDWKDRYGKANEHNAKVPRDFWLEEWEKKAIIDFHAKNPLNGYRRLCYMMIDEDIVSVGPSTVRNVLRAAGLMDRFKPKPSTKGRGFEQPRKPHEHWHIDVTHINISGTFFYLTTVLDGASRYIVHWEIKTSMTEADIEIIIERAREKCPGANPRIISDNGPQFMAKDFKEYVRLCGMTHVRTSPYYPQSNGKIEAWHKTLKKECIRPSAPRSLEEAETTVSGFVDEYNTRRLHSGIGYITPADMLAGRQTEIHEIRDKRVEIAREARKASRQMLRHSEGLRLDEIMEVVLH